MCKVLVFLFTLKTNTELASNKSVLGGVFDFVNLKDNMFSNSKVHHRWDWFITMISVAFSLKVKEK